MGENADHTVKLHADKRPQCDTAREARIFMQTVGRGKQVDPAEEGRVREEQRFKRAYALFDPRSLHKIKCK